MPRLSAFMFAAALASLAAPGASAQGVEQRLRDALRATTQQLRALEEEQAKWQTQSQAKEAQHKKEVDALREELAGARRAAARTGQSSRRELDQKLETAQQKLATEKLARAQADEALQQCQQRSADSERTARSKEAERVQLAGKADGLASRTAACEAKNGRLFRVGKEILDWLQGQGVGAALAAREPFLGLKRVELENTAQDYEDKLLDQRVAPAK